MSVSKEIDNKTEDQMTKYNIYEINIIPFLPNVGYL